MNLQEIQEKLKAPFDPRQISWRAGATNKDKTSALALAYIQARDVMKRLDDVMTIAGWDNDFEVYPSGMVVCRIGLKLPDGKQSRWVWKGNGAGETNIEAAKGSLSDAFKRAATMWGIGRYLYYLPTVWTKYDGYKFVETPKLPEWAIPKEETE